MILANTVRTGNWCYQSDKYGNGKLSTYQIYNLSILNSGGVVADYYKDFKPILITEKILLDCGATKLKTKRGFGASYKLGSLTINYSCFGNYYYKKNVYNTVHQIQNLYYAIEQEELLINL